ncbi:MAG TPA: hypothetical protein VIC82_08145 [Candidatus Nanopelagicales bacterium]
MAKSGRIAAVLVALAAVVAVAAGVVVYLVAYPPTASASPVGSASAEVTMQTVPAYNQDPEPTWVSYMIKQGDSWVHTTMFQVPAHSLVHFTVYQFDTGSPLRNPFMNQTANLVGGAENVNGKDVSLIDANVGDGVGHSFAIPALGVSAIFPGVSGDSTNQCDVAAPCPMTFDHNTITFTIQTGDPGSYAWQCFVPCALGYPIGFGGPMSTLGYMNGFMEVVA